MKKGTQALSTLFENYFAYKYEHASEGTRTQVRSLFDRHLRLDYGNIPVRALNDTFASDCVQHYINKPMRHADKRAVIAMLSDLCSYAVQRGQIRYDPFYEIRLPVKETVRHHSLNEDDVRFIMKLDPHVMEFNYFQVKLLTGTRTAECLALRWDDIDFDRGVIHVHDQLKYIASENGGRCLALAGHTKNIRARILHPPALTFELLKIRKEEQKKENSNENITCMNKLEISSRTISNLIYTHEDGSPVTSHKICITFKNSVAKPLGKTIRLHDLRITNATIKYRITHDLAGVRDDLGHSSAEVTMKYYIDPDPLEGIAAASAMDEYYKRIKQMADSENDL